MGLDSPLPDDLQRCLEVVNAQYAPQRLTKWEVRGFEGGVLRLSCEPGPDEGWTGGHFAARTAERELVLEGEILHYDADDGVVLVDGVNWGESFSAGELKGLELSYDPIPYGLALTRAYQVLDKEPELLETRLQRVMGRAAPAGLPPWGPGAAVQAPKGNAALELWGHDWGIVWGPPGTGKTECLSAALAFVGAAGVGKTLVLAPTHRAVDEVALRVCEKLSAAGALCDEQGRCRVFRGGQAGDKLRKAFPMAVEGGASGGELPELAALFRQLRQAVRGKRHGDAAALARQLRSRRQALGDGTLDALTAGPQTLVFATVQKALGLVASDEALPMVPKVVIDEAGMVSRAACLAASALGHSILLAGDPKQIGPICQVKRGLSRFQRRWLTHSGLSHLDTPVNLPDNARFLDLQYRMHPQICRAVSRFAYGGRLKDGEGVAEKTEKLRLPEGFPKARAAFLVLDDMVAAPSAAAHTKAKGRGHERRASAEIVASLAVAAAEEGRTVLALTPYRAQVRRIAALVDARYEGNKIMVGTIHGQQGAERDVVILDLVNAADAWQPEELEMLLNVAASRARASFILVGSRGELQRSDVRRMAGLLEQDTTSISIVDEEGQSSLGMGASTAPVELAPAKAEALALTLGDEIRALHKRLPLYSEEQLELIERNLGHGHYLVRGVAGSGKTLVLANWALRHLQRRPRERVLVTYFNRGLSSMLEAMLESVRRDLFIEKGLLDKQLEVRYVAKVPAQEQYDAVFVDEAQDILPKDLDRLYHACRARPDGKGRLARSFVMFYDDSQNIYGRELLEELKDRLPEDFSFSGRSTVLRETYRSTRAILDLSLNLALDPKHVYGPERSGLLGYFKIAELAGKGLLQRPEEAPDGVYHVHYTDRQGVRPSVIRAASARQVPEEAARLVARLVRDEKVDPSDIMVVSVKKPEVLAEAIAATGTRAEAFGGKKGTTPAKLPARGHDFVRCTTVFSCKGHESPVVVFANAQDVEDLEWMGQMSEQKLDFERIRRCMLYVAASRAMVKLYVVGAASPAMAAAAEYGFELKKRA